MQELDGRKYFWKFTHGDDKNKMGGEYVVGLNENNTIKEFNPTNYDCPPEWFYFVGNNVKGFIMNSLKYKEDWWLRKVEIPDDARVRSLLDRYVADKVILYPKIPLWPDGILQLLKDPQVLNHISRDMLIGDELLIGDDLLLPLMKNGASVDAITWLYSNYPPTDPVAKFMVGVYIGKEELIEEGLTYWVDLLSELLKYPSVCNRVFELPRKYRELFTEILILRRHLPSLLNLYLAAPMGIIGGRTSLEKHIINLVELQDKDGRSKVEPLSTATIFSILKNNPGKLSSRLLTLFNKRSADIGLEVLIISQILYHENTLEVETRLVEAYNRINKKYLKPTEKAFIFALDEGKKYLGHYCGDKDIYVTPANLLHALEIFKVKPTIKLVRKQTISSTVPTEIIRVWNKLVRQNTKVKEEICNARTGWQKVLLETDK